jgi:hypothetical protein
MMIILNVQIAAKYYLILKKNNLINSDNFLSKNILGRIRILSTTTNYYSTAANYLYKLKFVVGSVSLLSRAAVVVAVSAVRA